MAVAKLTKSLVDGMPKGVIWDTLCVGFGARKQTRDAHFLLRYRVKGTGKQKFRSIGRHGHWTVEAARAEAKRLMGLVVSGEDIDGAKANSDLFGDLIDRYLSAVRIRPRSLVEFT